MQHAQLDARSLVFARAIAERLRSRPELVDVARANLHRWMAARPISPSRLKNAREWLEVIDSQPLEGVLRCLLRENSEGQRMRQNSPFVGILTQEEVLQMKKEFAHAAH